MAGSTMDGRMADGECATIARDARNARKACEKCEKTQEEA